MTRMLLEAETLNTIFHECRQCGTCCRKYRKIALQPDEVAFIEKMGGFVGVVVSMKDIQNKGLEEAGREAKAQGKVFMIHPDDNGCVFLFKTNGKYACKIYNYRPKTCRGFRCNMADNSFLSLFGDEATSLLGQDSYGLPVNGESIKKK